MAKRNHTAQSRSPSNLDLFETEAWKKKGPWGGCQLDPETGLKRCSGCKQYKPSEEFYKNPCKPDGLKPHCKKCSNKMSNLAYSRKPEIREKRSKYSQDYKANFPEKNSLSKNISCAKERCAKRGLSFSISLDSMMDLLRRQNGCCAISGIKMTFSGHGKVLPTSCTMDRIIPSAGYVDGNIRLVCSALNMFRGDMTDEQFWDFVSMVSWKRQ